MLMKMKKDGKFVKVKRKVFIKELKFKINYFVWGRIYSILRMIDFIYLSLDDVCNAYIQLFKEEKNKYL